jgi:hypothetical protein
MNEYHVAIKHDDLDGQAEREGMAMKRAQDWSAKKVVYKSYHGSRSTTAHIRQENRNIDRVWRYLLQEDVKNHPIVL